MDGRFVYTADRVHHGLVDEKSADEGGHDHEDHDSDERQGALPGDIPAKNVIDNMVEHPPVHEQDGKAVRSKQGDNCMKSAFMLRFFVQSQCKDTAGHKEGNRSHVHIEIYITLPVGIRVDVPCHDKEGQNGQDPDETIKFACLRSGYPVADDGNADPFREKGKQIGCQAGIDPKRGAQKHDPGEGGQHPVGHGCKHILQKRNSDIDRDGDIDQP